MTMTTTTTNPNTDKAVDLIRIKTGKARGAICPCGHVISDKRWVGKEVGRHAESCETLKAIESIIKP